MQLSAASRLAGARPAVAQLHDRPAASSACTRPQCRAGRAKVAAHPGASPPQGPGPLPPPVPPPPALPWHTPVARSSVARFSPLPICCAGQQRQQQLAQQPQQRARRALRRLAAVPPAAAAAPAAPAAVDPATLKAYLKVQNGSDVRGVAIDTNPNEPITLTPAMMFFLGRAFAGEAPLRGALTHKPGGKRVAAGEVWALSPITGRGTSRRCSVSEAAAQAIAACARQAAPTPAAPPRVPEWLSENKGHPVGTLRVSTGHDPRLSSPLMDASLAAGLAAAGAQVARFGGCTTPAMFMSCILPGERGAGGGAGLVVRGIAGPELCCTSTQGGQMFCRRLPACLTTHPPTHPPPPHPTALPSLSPARPRVRRCHHDHRLPPAGEPQRSQVLHGRGEPQPSWARQAW